jgi:hypothetical protein
MRGWGISLARAIRASRSGEAAGFGMSNPFCAMAISGSA